MKKWCFSVVALVALLSGCTATHTALGKKELVVQTKMSDSIFMEPVEAKDRTVFVQARNTSEVSEFDIAADLRQSLQARGYRVLESPSRAHYILQVNVLQIAKTDQAGAAGSGAIEGAASGALLGSVLSSSSRDVAGAALVLGALGLALDATVKDVYYRVVTDIQIQERVKQGRVATSSRHELQQGSSGGTSTTYTKKGDMLQYQTRIVSSANQANLELPQALPALRQDLVRSISGLF